MTVNESITAYFAEIDKLAAGSVPELDSAVCKGMAAERMSLAQRAANAQANPTAENLNLVAEGFAAVSALADGVRHTTGEPDASFAALNIAAANVVHAGQVARRQIARSFARQQIAAARANAVRA